MPKKKLITLEEHDAHIERLHADKVEHPGPVLNGIGCPRCHKELFDWRPNETLCPNNHPKKLIHCKECDYSGYRRT